jgi:hypothetical protein
MIICGLHINEKMDFLHRKHLSHHIISYTPSYLNICIKYMYLDAFQVRSFYYKYFFIRGCTVFSAQVTHFCISFNLTCTCVFTFRIRMTNAVFPILCTSSDHYYLSLV